MSHFIWFLEAWLVVFAMAVLFIGIFMALIDISARLLCHGIDWIKDRW